MFIGVMIVLWQMCCGIINVSRRLHVMLGCWRRFNLSEADWILVSCIGYHPGGSDVSKQWAAMVVATLQLTVHLPWTAAVAGMVANGFSQLGVLTLLTMHAS